MMETLLNLVKLNGLVQYLEQGKMLIKIGAKVRVKMCSDVDKREAKELFSVIFT